MHAVLSEVARDDVTATATVACWNGPASTLRWLTCGEHAPILVTEDGELEVLDGGVLPPLGDPAMPDTAEVQSRRINAGDRLILLSDGVLARPTRDGGTLGLDGIREAVGKAPRSPPPAPCERSRNAVREAVDDPLDDDATVVVLVPGRSAPE